MDQTDQNQLNQDLIDASEKGDIEKVKECLEFGADIHAQEDYALRWASLYGHTETVEFLLKNGANIHAQEDLALRWASGNGYTETVELLLSHYSTEEICVLIVRQLKSKENKNLIVSLANELKKR